MFRPGRQDFVKNRSLQVSLFQDSGISASANTESKSEQADGVGSKTSILTKFESTIHAL